MLAGRRIAEQCDVSHRTRALRLTLLVRVRAEAQVAEARDPTSQIRTAWTFFATSGWPAYDSQQRLTRVFDVPPSVTAYLEEPHAACGRTVSSRRFLC
jgi:carboxylesterase type B